MGINVKLTKDEKDSSVDTILYKSMIGNLLYLTASHPDICYNVRVSARYQANLKKSYWAIVKRMIHYVISTIDFCI